MSSRREKGAGKMAVPFSTGPRDCDAALTVVAPWLMTRRRNPPGPNSVRDSADWSAHRTSILVIYADGPNRVTTGGKVILGGRVRIASGGA